MRKYQGVIFYFVGMIKSPVINAGNFRPTFLSPPVIALDVTDSTHSRLL